MLVPALALSWGVARAAAPVDAWMEAVVLVEQGSTMCAGVVIDPAGTVATAYHCVAAGGRPKVRRSDGSQAVGRVRSVDRARDLALVDAPGTAGGAWLPVAEGEATLGEPVWALGHPSGGDLPAGFYSGTLRFSASSGIVSAVGSEALQISAPVNPGNSGGPVVDERGEVVGIVSRRLAGQSLSFAGRADHLQALAPDDSGQSPLGGTVALELALAAYDQGNTALGAHLEVALRDRVVVEGSVGFPLGAKWAAARFGEVAFLRGEVHGGLRQRVGRGSWATRLDAWGGVAQHERLTADPADPFFQQTEVSYVPVVGGALRVRSIGFEVGYGLTERVGRAALVLRVPGVVTVF